MKRASFLLLLLFNFLLVSCSEKIQYDLAIINVNIFDSKSKKVLENKTILINADTIASIIDGRQKVNAIEVIEGNGRLTIPGFIDTHVHLHQIYAIGNDVAPKQLVSDSLTYFRNILADQYLKYGTTTIVDMGQPESWMEVTTDWQKNPSPDYPNIFNTGGALISDLEWDKKPPMHHTRVFNPAYVNKKVQEYEKLGLKHLKLYWKLEEEDMKAVIAEAKNQNMNFYAHVDNNITTISRAMDFGVKNFEHFFTLVAGTLTLSDHWDSLNEKYNLDKIRNIDEYAAVMVFFFDYIKENPELEQKLLDLLDKMAHKKASISTTIHVLGATAGKTDFFSSFKHFPLRDSADLSYSTLQKQQLEHAFDVMMEFLKLAHEKGVKIRIGTDCRNGGRALLSELILLYKADFSIEDILQIATLNGAKAMNIEDHYGIIAVGNKADLVIFHNSPFEDFKSFLSEKIVIKGGKLYQDN